MIALDELAPNFRRARARWPKATTLCRHYDDLATTYAGNQHSLIELVKSFLESVCITILVDHGKHPPSDAQTTGLLTSALGELGLKNSRGTTRFDKVLSAYNQLADALNHVRNNEGPVAHGKDGFLDALTANHNQVYLLSADAILSLILNAMEGKEPDLQHTRQPYNSFDHFNHRIDRTTHCVAEVQDDGDDVEIVVKFSTGVLDEVELRIKPSEFLFQHDRNAYIEILNAASAATAASPPDSDDADDSGGQVEGEHPQSDADPDVPGGEEA